MAETFATRAWEFAGLIQTVATNDPAMLAWLGTFLEPSFAPCTPTPALAVRFVVDDRRHDRLRDRGPAPAVSMSSGFALDASTTLLRPWQPIDRPVLHDPEYDAYFESGDFTRCVTVVARRENRWARLAAMRILRERAMAAVLDAGGLLLHAAGVIVADRIVAIAGPKRAGKSTLLLHLLGSGATRLVANDRLAALPTASGWRAIGIPTVVNIRPESLDLVGRSPTTGLPDPSLTVTAPSERHETPPPRGTATRGDAVMSPPDLAALLGTTLAPSATLGAVLLPQRDSWGSRPSSTDETVSDLRDGLFRAGQAYPIDSVFVDRQGAIDSSSLACRLADLARSIPVLPARLTRAALADRSHARGLVEHMARLVHAPAAPGASAA